MSSKKKAIRRPISEVGKASRASREGSDAPSYSKLKFIRFFNG
uniref:Uncharacterized protein n=1 Tax=Arundo donax TaxID=35708 RepID=A0A0A9H1U7_ARUDO